MEENEDSNEKDEITEPQITSLDPNERKLARRMRIQRRLEVIRKQQLQDEGVEELEEIVKSLLEEQVEHSAHQLEQLTLEGKELVTNVRVANDTREVQRREEDVVAREQRIQKLEEEAAKSMDMFEAINVVWEEITTSNDPLDIFHDMEAQKVKCRELIDQKNDLIEELRKEIKLVDERFDKDQRKQKQDLILIVQRIDNQVNVMKRAYRQELALIEQAINTERRQQIEAANKRWESLFKEREKEEVQNMQKKFSQVNDLAEEINLINVEHQEKFRETKITLETDIQVLQQELEQVKALCLLNTEKLDYNLQVLKKRDEENILIKAQQKRRINRLQDLVNSLRDMIRETEQTTASERARLTDDVNRLHRSIIGVEHKADHFSEINDVTYQKVWEMNAEAAEKLLDQILTTDRLIYEQQLGLDWTPPDLSLLDLADLPSFRAAHQSFKHRQHAEGSGTNTVTLPPAHAPVLVDGSMDRGERRLLQHIVRRVADNSGFLIESRVFSLLFPYTKKEKTLVKIDNVFSALGIKSEEDMLVMKSFFVPYSYCNICASYAGRYTSAQTNLPEVEVESTAVAVQEEHKPTSSVMDVVEASEFLMAERFSALSTYRPSATLGEEEDPLAGLSSTTISSAQTGKQQVRVANNSKDSALCSPDHVLTIDPIYVLRALRDFINYFTDRKDRKLVNMTSRLAKKRNTMSRMLKAEDVIQFWDRFKLIFSPEKEKLWDGLFVGLQKYHVILEDRHKLNVETGKLRSQNAELRRLLQSYMPTDVRETDLHV